MACRMEGPLSVAAPLDAGSHEMKHCVGALQVHRGAFTEGRWTGNVWR